jgi:hypothetical protein
VRTRNRQRGDNEREQNFGGDRVHFGSTGWCRIRPERVMLKMLKDF